MTPEQIREIVVMTINELSSRDMMGDPYLNILRETEKEIYKFFESSGDTTNISIALRTLSDDAYIDIIYLQYRDGKTIEFIAEALEKDVTTILRNKKRIIKELYKRLK